jgi:4-amino-4-deoxy-L-arabinose transferase-like glycosyltransferase
MTHRTLFALLVALAVAALAVRLYPLVAGMPALAQAFVTEDGYLMLTVARNMALGLGMSVSEGTIATNGVQPLATFLYAGAYLAAGGDKVGGLVGVHLIQAAAALAALFAVAALARRMAGPLFGAPVWPWLVAVLWFSGPLLLLHSMNGLETGLYTLTVALVLLAFARVMEREIAGQGARPGDGLLLGGLCGIAFLARNDGAFLVIAVFALWGLHALIVQRAGLRATLLRLLPGAVLCLALAAPWLLNNALRFGSIVPISGTAQAGSFGGNAAGLPAVLFEHMTAVLPLPSGVEARAPVQVVAGLTVVAALGWFGWRVWRQGGPARPVVGAYLLFAGALVFFYGFVHGAPHFLSRYLAPLAPLLITAAVLCALDVFRALGARPAAPVGLAVAALALAVALNARQLWPGVRAQGHFQVVDWVAQNVAPDTWVGAVQTGTLGYWHDRTINLDGKVNPEALRIRRATGDVRLYVVDSPIEVLADWVGIATWVETGGEDFVEAFELVVADEAANLAVLRRQGVAE